MQENDVKIQISGFLEQNKDEGRNYLLKKLKSAFKQGKLDHNLIRKVIIEISRAHDLKAVLFGSLLLQLDNDEIIELFKNKL